MPTWYEHKKITISDCARTNRQVCKFIPYVVVLLVVAVAAAVGGGVVVVVVVVVC